MKCSITQYRACAVDANGNPIPVGDARGILGRQCLSAVGAFAALSAECRFIRLATDTAIQMDIQGGATTVADEVFPAGVEFIAVNGGETFTIAAA